MRVVLTVLLSKGYFIETRHSAIASLSAESAPPMRILTSSVTSLPSSILSMLFERGYVVMVVFGGVN